MVDGNCYQEAAATNVLLPLTSYPACESWCCILRKFNEISLLPPTSYQKPEHESNLSHEIYISGLQRFTVGLSHADVDVEYV